MTKSTFASATRLLATVLTFVVIASCAGRADQEPSDGSQPGSSGSETATFYDMWEMDASQFGTLARSSARLLGGGRSSVSALGYGEDRESTVAHLLVAQGDSLSPLLVTELAFSRLLARDEAHPIYAYYHEIVLMPSSVFGEWNGYFYVHDHNGNGRDEVIAMQLAGSHFVPLIYEYHDGEFRSVMPHSERGTITAGWEAPERGRIVVFERDGEGRLVRFAYVWDPGINEYREESREEISGEREGELGLPVYERE